MIPRNMCIDTGKLKHPNRLAAESALAAARMQWRRTPSRAPQPPDRIYRCQFCQAWHLTHAVKT